MNEEKRNKIQAAYGKAVMWHNSVEFVLEQFLATELSKKKGTVPSTELAEIKKSASEFGKKLVLFRESLLLIDSDARLQTIYNSLYKVGENRKYLAHATAAESGVFDAENNFHTHEFVVLEWTKKDGTIVPQSPLTEKWLEKIIDQASEPVILIQEYWKSQIDLDT